VVGSFQKDGVGLGEGLQPKLVKGPDLLVATLEWLHASVPELVVLLTGLARGYVRTELERRAIPHRPVFLGSRPARPPPCASFAVRIDRERVGRYTTAASRWLRLLLPARARPGLRVFYGHDRVPEPGEPVAGGTAKFQRLASRFPNSPTDFTLLYVSTTWLPRDLRPLLGLARRRHAPIVLNQNGVAYPGWAGAATEELNRPYRRALLAADHVLYQSEFCKRASDAFLGEPNGSWEVLYNAVDVDHFTPAPEPLAGGPVLVLGGDQTQEYRLELALRAFAP